MGWYPYKAIAAGRHLRGMTQEELAVKLAAETGKRWTRGMVAQLEVGRKHFTVDILLAVSRVLDLPIDFFAYEPGKVRANPGYRDLVGSVTPASLTEPGEMDIASVRGLLDRIGAGTQDHRYLPARRYHLRSVAA